MDVKRTIYDLCPDKRDTYIVVIEVQYKLCYIILIDFYTYTKLLYGSVLTVILNYLLVLTCHLVSFLYFEP